MLVVLTLPTRYPDGENTPHRFVFPSSKTEAMLAMPVSHDPGMVLVRRLLVSTSLLSLVRALKPAGRVPLSILFGSRSSVKPESVLQAFGMLGAQE